jgi:hypothetical protein
MVSQMSYSEGPTRPGSSLSLSRDFIIYALESLSYSPRCSKRLEDNPTYPSYGPHGESPGKILYGEVVSIADTLIGN